MTRSSTILLALALALIPVAGAAPVLAQDSPEAAVNGVFDAIDAMEFDRVGEFVCEAEREAVTQQFDLTAAFAEIPGVDPEALLDAIDFQVADRSVSLVSQEEDAAVVAVSARLTGVIDDEGARTFIRQVLEAFGQEATDENVEAYLADLKASIEEGEAIDSEVDVVLEGGAWLVCEELTGDGEEPIDEPIDPSVTPAPVENSLCDLLPLDELNALGPLEYATATAYVSDSCQYDADMETAFHSMGLYVEAFTDFEELKTVYGDLEDIEVAGFPAATDGTSVWVSTDKGILLVFPSVFDLEGVDLVEYATQVAELVVPRWLEQ